MTTHAASTRLISSERLVKTEQGPLFVTDQGLGEPAIVAMHGFPDDHRIYDRLVPQLQPTHRGHLRLAGIRALRTR